MFNCDDSILNQCSLLINTFNSIKLQSNIYLKALRTLTVSLKKFDIMSGIFTQKSRGFKFEFSQMGEKH